MLCHNCKKQVFIDEKTKVGFREECPHCGSYLHCCLNCRFYDEGRANKCFEPQAEFVSDKEKGNYCEYFEVMEGDGRGEGDDEKDKARSQFDSLFKD